MKTWQYILIYVLIGIVVYYLIYKAYYSPPTPIVTLVGPTGATGSTERTILPAPPVNATYTYTVTTDASGNCVYLMIATKDGVKIGTYQIDETQFVNLFGGWANVCRRFSNVPCIKGKCTSILPPPPPPANSQF